MFKLFVLTCVLSVVAGTPGNLFGARIVAPIVTAPVAVNRVATYAVRATPVVGSIVAARAVPVASVITNRAAVVGPVVAARSVLIH